MWQDIRYGMRMFLKTPVFSALAIMTLALGIGANTAVFSVVNSILLKPLPYPQADRLVRITSRSTREADAPIQVSAPNFVDWRSQNQSFEKMAAYFQRDCNLSGGGNPERLRSLRTSADFFSVLGVAPVMGRTFTAEEDRPNGPPVAMLGYGFWQRRFAGQAGIINQSITIDGRNTVVVGVFPTDLNYLRDVDVVMPLAPDPEADRLLLFLTVIARLKSGVTIDQASSDMKNIAARLEQQYPATNQYWSANVTSLQDDRVGSVRSTLILLLGAVVFVLLIATANIANLLLARASARQKEISVRSALGAGGLRIARQLMTESVLLSMTGGLFGLGLAYLATRSLVKLAPAIPRINEIGIDFRVLIFTLGISILTGILFGLAPAVRAQRLDLNESLKEGSKGNSAGRKQRLRAALIVTEIALSLVLLIGAGLLLRSFQRLHDVRLGFNSDDVLTFDLMLPRAKYTTDSAKSKAFEDALAQIKLLPGVTDAALTSTIPLAGRNAMLLFYGEGRPARGPEDYVAANYNVVSPGYFHALGIPVLRGRDLSEDDRADKPGVVVISESMARRFWPNQDAVGKRMKLGAEDDPQEPWLNIIGIVGDVKQTGLEKSQGEATMYTNYLQQPGFSSAFIVRSPQLSISGNAFQQALSRVDNDLPIANVRSLDQVVSQNFAARRFSLFLIGGFALLALALAAIGIYGVMSYAVTQRTSEIGIRIALGARSLDVLKMIIGQGMLLTVIGVAIGLLGAFTLTRLMKALLFDVAPTDLLTFGSVAALLSLVALLACYLPARRATKVDPLVALRYE